MLVLKFKREKSAYNTLDLALEQKLPNIYLDEYVVFSATNIKLDFQFERKFLLSKFLEQLFYCRKFSLNFVEL